MPVSLPRLVACLGAALVLAGCMTSSGKVKRKAERVITIQRNEPGDADQKIAMTSAH